MAVVNSAGISKSSKLYLNHNFFCEEKGLPKVENGFEKENYVSRPQQNWTIDNCSVRSLGSRSSVNINVKQLKNEASKTIQNVKVTFDSLSQKLRRSTRRRCRLESDSPIKEQKSCKTPVKMYSPFKIETPGKVLRKVNGNTCSPRRRFQSFNSPSQLFHKDVEAVSRGTRQLKAMASGISKRSSFRN